MTLFNSTSTTQVAHSTWAKTKNPEYMAWLHVFHSLLGDLGGKIMSKGLSDQYLEFRRVRHENCNALFFVCNIGLQKIFTSS